MERMIDRKSPETKDVLILVGGVDTLEKQSGLILVEVTREGQREGQGAENQDDQRVKLFPVGRTLDPTTLERLKINGRCCLKIRIFLLYRHRHI